MWILIIGLIVLTAIAMAVGYARNKKIQKKIESGEMPNVADNMKYAKKKVCWPP